MAKSSQIPDPLVVEVSEWPTGKDTYVLRVKPWAYRTDRKGRLRALLVLLDVLQTAVAWVQMQIKVEYKKLDQVG